MNKLSDQIKREKEARLRLEEHLKETLIKKAEADDPDYKYKAELINENFETIVDDEKAYKFVVEDTLESSNLDSESRKLF